MDANLSDDELIGRFEAGTLSDFPHAMHVRVTLLYLFRHGYEEALRRMTEGLKNFVSRKGVPEKFHFTMTRAWVELLESARQLRPDADTPEALVRAFPELLEKNALLSFYSPNELQSETARVSWLPPDLARQIEARLLPARKQNAQVIADEKSR